MEGFVQGWCAAGERARRNLVAGNCVMGGDEVDETRLEHQQFRVASASNSADWLPASSFSPTNSFHVTIIVLSAAHSHFKEPGTCKLSNSLTPELSTPQTSFQPSGAFPTPPQLASTSTTSITNSSHHRYRVNCPKKNTFIKTHLAFFLYFCPNGVLACWLVLWECTCVVSE